MPTPRTLHADLKAHFDRLRGARSDTQQRIRELEAELASSRDLVHVAKLTQALALLHTRVDALSARITLTRESGDVVRSLVRAVEPG